MTRCALGNFFVLLPLELAGGRKAVDENQRKPLTGDTHGRVAYRHVSRRHHSCCCGHSCAPSTYAAVWAYRPDPPRAFASLPKVAYFCGIPVEIGDRVGLAAR